MKDADEKHYFYALLIKAYEGRLESDEIILLNQYIKSDDEAARLYVEFFDTVSSLVDMNDKHLTFEDNDSARYDRCLDSLARAEIEAPAFKITIPEEPLVLIQKVQHPKIEYKISRRSLFTLFTAAAAIILILTLMNIIPPATGFKVAVLSDVIDAKWSDFQSGMEKGDSVYTSPKKIILKKGYAAFLFDNQTLVTLEGPAEFQILSDDKMNLQYGKLYAKVPSDAIGFTITTQNAKVIDLGTEFGVEVNAVGDTSLYVVKGKTALIVSEESQKVSMEVIQGNAKKVTAATCSVSDIRWDSELFVRTIDSRNHTIWKGQLVLSLADIVGGGNGFGNGKNDIGIDPSTGKQATTIAPPNSRMATNEYHRVAFNPCIDGVFVPNGKTNQIISSQGHIFRECPISDGNFYSNIGNVMKYHDSQTAPEITPDQSPSTHLIQLHANSGITFDLQALRALLPGASIVRFQSRFGIDKKADRPIATNADFWILVDGKLRYQKTQVKELKLFDVSIELSEENRFLTLITTDGQDPEGRIVEGFGVLPNDSDWCVFADPVLIAE